MSYQGPDRDLNQPPDFRRLLREQLFWGMLGPLVPNVILVVLIYNIAPSGLALIGLIVLYWLGIGALIAFIAVERGRHNDVLGEDFRALLGAWLGTALVVLFAHLQWTIFTTFVEEPVNAFIFILLINLLGTLGALLGFHSKRLPELFT